jgi:DUF2934 family protein
MRGHELARETRDPEVPSMTRETHEEIARRAYEIYVSRGGNHGFDLADWLQAESQVTTITQRPEKTAKQHAAASTKRRSRHA